jgi:hypothetical protein
LPDRLLTVRQSEWLDREHVRKRTVERARQSKPVEREAGSE